MIRPVAQSAAQAHVSLAGHAARRHVSVVGARDPVVVDRQASVRVKAAHAATAAALSWKHLARAKLDRNEERGPFEKGEEGSPRAEDDHGGKW
jgi:hypothetical protein